MTLIIGHLQETGHRILNKTWVSRVPRHALTEKVTKFFFLGLQQKLKFEIWPKTNHLQPLNIYNAPSQVYCIISGGRTHQNTKG